MATNDKEFNMNILVKLFVAVLLVLGIFNYLSYSKTGNIPLLEWSKKFTQDGAANFTQQVAEKLVVDAKKMTSEMLGDKIKSTAPVQIYKWTDAKGIVHYDNKPVKGATELTIDVNANMLSMEKPVDVSDPQAKKSEPQSDDEQARTIREAMRARMDALTN